jgi:hypothetical protein
VQCICIFHYKSQASSCYVVLLFIEKIIVCAFCYLLLMYYCYGVLKRKVTNFRTDRAQIQVISDKLSTCMGVAQNTRAFAASNVLGVQVIARRSVYTIFVNLVDFLCLLSIPLKKTYIKRYRLWMLFKGQKRVCQEADILQLIIYYISFFLYSIVLLRKRLMKEIVKDITCIE